MALYSHRGILEIASGVVGRSREGFCRPSGQQKLHQKVTPKRGQSSRATSPRTFRICSLSSRPPQSSTWSRIPMEYPEERDLISPVLPGICADPCAWECGGRVGGHDGSTSATWRRTPGKGSRALGLPFHAAWRARPLGGQM